MIYSPKADGIDQDGRPAARQTMRLSPPQRNTTPSRGMGRRKLRVAILLLVVGDAGKFAPDATQLPTGCQPESLAKPARRRSHKPQRVYRGPREKQRRTNAWRRATSRSMSLKLSCRF
jgi:hypothetical protein